ncbi:hypothetical protein [Enorma massiliensis]|uniref:Uncharacterized protein n=1 Tax=Enorma massiliensis TaxID=1472761 RepID=A0A1Y3U4R7_9ACTN|nr:hypothetical protein [Enorma massiliensis]OUN43762.1 hypothetical protein B5G21_03490 [Enorma massiliensis]
MREVVPCPGCALAAARLPAGFTSEPELLCTARGGEAVGRDDGCTLGEPGAPAQADPGFDVTIEGAESCGVWPAE